MDNQHDRIAIIGAIENASTNELKALADIKNAIVANEKSGSAAAGENKGRVSRRLSRAGTQPSTINDVESETTQHRNSSYVSRIPKAGRRKPNLAVNPRGTLHNNDLNAPLPSVKARSVPLKPQSGTENETKHDAIAAGSSSAGAQRDGRGRFTSQNQQAQIAESNGSKRQNSAMAKLQEGFLRRLGSVVGLDDKRNKSDGNDVTNAAGVGIGGPLWMATSGVADLVKETGSKAISLKKWVDDLNGAKTKKDKKTVLTPDGAKPEPITYPPAQARPITPPRIGNTGSSKVFDENQASQSIKAVQEQTKTLSSKDDRIIGVLEDVEDEIVKLRKSMSSGGGFSMPDFFRNRWPGRGRGSKRRAGGRSNGRGRNRSDRSDRPESSGHSSKKTRGGKPKGRLGRIGKLFSSVGAKVAAGTAATIGAVTGASALGAKGADAAATTAKATLQEGKTAAQVAKKGGEAAVTKQAGHITGAAAEKGAEAAAAQKAGKVTGSVALKETEHVAAKMGVKAAAKGALRLIPGVGTALLAGYDAVEGFNDEEAQREAFGLAEGQEVSTKQKTAYAGANVLDMGGLVSGATNLVGQGLSAVGFDGAGEKLQSFGTDSIARGLDGGMDFAQTLFSGAKDLALGAAATVVEKVKSGLTSDEENAKQLKTSIEDGTRKTVTAIDGLKGQLQGGQLGEDGVGDHGYTSKAEFTAPTANNIAADLNIGGSNAKNRNFRNNNLGNLVYANQEGASLEAANSKGERRFAKFNTPEEGIRGLANQVSSYYEGTSKAAGYEKLQTVSSIISKWAPPNENNTNQYIKNVCDYLGVSPNEKIDASDPEVMTRLVRAIATKEGGNPAVNDGYIKDALGTFNKDTGKWEGKFSEESLTKINAARTANGEQAISADSQYSAGSKVKLAGAAIPAMSAKNAVSFKTPATEGGVTQHAQSVKAPTRNLVAAKPNSPSEQASKSKVTSTSVGEKAKQLATVDAPASQALEPTEALQNPESGGLLSVMGDLGTSSVSAMTGLMSANSPDAVEAAINKSRELDKKISEKVQGWTGKKVGFTPAAPLAALQQAKKPSSTPNTDKAKDIDLLGNASATDVDLNTALNERGIPVYDNGYKVLEEGQGKEPSFLESSVDGLKSLGSAILPTAGEHVSRLIGGISGGGVVNDLMSQVTGGNTDIARAVSPLTQKAGQWLDGGIQSAASTVSSTAGGINESLFGAQPARQEPFLSMPPQLPTVTDLARSGVRSTLSTDNINNDPAMLKALDGVYSVLKDILGATKSGGKGDPDKVVKTAQPQPRERASTTISDPSLDVLLED